MAKEKKKVESRAVKLKRLAEQRREIVRAETAKKVQEECPPSDA